MNQNLQVNKVIFTYEMLCTMTQFEAEAKGNSHFHLLHYMYSTCMPKQLT